MPLTQRIVEPTAYSLDHVVADLAAIRRFNPQRFEFEQLTAVVYDDPEAHIVVGYKDINENDFWVRGHMPGRPFMPGVLMCEAAAQLCSYHAHRHDLTGGKVLGFGGLEEVRFRRFVEIPSRLVIAAQVTKVRRGMMVIFRFQCFVGDALVCDGELRGIGLPATEATVAV